MTAQMSFRLQEGKGEAKYIIGVEVDGKATGLNKKEMFDSLSKKKKLCFAVISMRIRNAL